MDSSPSRPTQAVCYGEVSAVRGVCYNRVHCILIHILLYIYIHTMCALPSTGKRRLKKLWSQGKC